MESVIVWIWYFFAVYASFMWVTVKIHASRSSCVCLTCFCNTMLHPLNSQCIQCGLFTPDRWVTQVLWLITADYIFEKEKVKGKQVSSIWGKFSQTVAFSNVHVGVVAYEWIKRRGGRKLAIYWHSLLPTSAGTKDFIEKSHWHNHNQSFTFTL